MTFGRRVPAEVPKIVGVPTQQAALAQDKFNRALLQAEEGGLPPGAATVVPGTQVFGAGSVGTATDGWAPISHVHPLSSGTPAALGESETQGSSANPARVDHVHAIKVRAAADGTLVGTRKRLNLISGEAITVTGADDAGGDELDLTVKVADNGISNVKLRDSAATSVIGRSAGSTGDPADIATAADHDVLRRRSGTLGFGTIAPESLDNTKSGTKALTNAVHTGIFDVAVPSGDQACGRALISIEIDDGTDFEAYSDVCCYSAVNKAGTVTGAVSATTIGAKSFSTGVGTGVLFSVLVGANKITFRIRATSGLGAPTTLTCKWQAVDLTGQTITPL